MIVPDSLQPPGQTTVSDKPTPYGLQMLSLWQRLVNAGYTVDQADAVLGIVRQEPEKMCATCDRAYGLSSPFCPQCIRNPAAKDHWKARYE